MDRATNSDVSPGDDEVITKATSTQLRHFADFDPRCRALQLPDGIMLRYSLARCLYFYLRTGVVNGKITTQVFASDSPYNRTSTSIGHVDTPLFEENSEDAHIFKIKRLLLSWADFVKEDSDSGEEFRAFAFNNHFPL